jgi:hypothetical protein
LSRRHDLVAVSLSDPREWQLPDVGFINLQDAETGEQVLVDSGHRGLRDFFAAEQRAVAERRATLFRKTGIDEIAIDASKPYVDPLIHFFRARMKPLRRG